MMNCGEGFIEAVFSLCFRPGCCARHGFAEGYRSSTEFPDETLAFIKSHPLMDSAVPSISEEPWFTKTRVRYDIQHQLHSG